MRLTIQECTKCTINLKFRKKTVLFKKYKTFSVLIYSYINTSGIPHNFEFFQFSRVLI